jgi:hypothetical protein
LVEQLTLNQRAKGSSPLWRIFYWGKKSPFHVIPAKVLRSDFRRAGIHLFPTVFRAVSPPAVDRAQNPLSQESWNKGIDSGV